MLWSILPMLLSGIILLLVLTLIVLRPKNLHVAWPAGIGALIAIAIGLLPLATLQTIFYITWDASATLICLFLLSEALDSNGFFNWAALLLARFAHGSGWRLYLLMLLLTTGVTALLANDGAVLMLTPIFVRLLMRVYPRKPGLWLAFLFATGFFADSMSTLFIPSNLTNIIIADATHINFVQFTLWMLLPALLTFAAGTLAFGIRFHRLFGIRYDAGTLEAPATALRSRRVFWIGWGVLLGLVTGYVLGSRAGLPISLIAGIAALVMVIVVHIQGLRSMPRILSAAPWNILIYAIGMFVVISAAFQHQVLTAITTPLLQYTHVHASSGQTISAGAILAVLSAIVNNLPATLIGVLVLTSVEHFSTSAVYAITIGVNIGPKLTPFGSLATLLWLGILARHDVRISWGEYVRENWWVTIVVLLAAFSGLFLTGLLLS